MASPDPTSSSWSQQQRKRHWAESRTYLIISNVFKAKNHQGVVVNITASVATTNAALPSRSSFISSIRSYDVITDSFACNLITTKKRRRHSTTLNPKYFHPLLSGAITWWWWFYGWVDGEMAIKITMTSQRWWWDATSGWPISAYVDDDDQQLYYCILPLSHPTW